MLVRCATSFAYGALLWHLRAKIPFFWWSIFPVGLFVAISYGTKAEIWGLLLMAPYAAVSLTTASLPFVRHAGRFGDPSYGIYIYSYLIQQSLVTVYPMINMPTFIFSAIVLSVAAGYISWYFVENPMLKLKPLLLSKKSTSSVQIQIQIT